MTVREKYNILLQTSVAAIIKDFIQANSKGIADENRLQLLRGETANGGKMRKYRSRSYERKKRAMNALAGGLTDLKLTGAFHKGIVFNPNTQEIKATSDPHKLVKKYEDKVIFGLNAKSRINYKEKYEQKFIDFYKKRVKL